MPHIESPFFDEIFSECHVDPEIKRIAVDLRTKGYAVISFPEQEIGDIAGRIVADLYPRYDWKLWRDEPGSFTTRIQDGWTFNENIKRIAANGTVMKMLETLYGRKAFPFQTLNFSVGSQQRVHSDSIHFSSNPERFMCGVWVALEDVDRENGPLLYYPGSHVWPIYTNEHIGVNSMTLNETYERYPKYEDMWQAVADAKKACPERFHAKKGQAIIWTANLLHGGDIHRDRTRTRWSQVTHYYFEKCSYYTPLLSEPYGGRIAFREPVDIATGVVMKNFAGGAQTPDNFIKTATSPGQPEQNSSRIQRLLRGLGALTKR